MAITYGFYNSMNGDRKYDAVQLSSIFDGVIRDGVFQSIGGYLATKPGTGMQVLVSPGKAWFDHTWTVNDALYPLDIGKSDLTLKRYDAVVLETDSSQPVRKNSIKIVPGTPSTDPKKPSMVSEESQHQHALAYILVNPGATEIQEKDIEIVVGKDECPFVTSILESVSIEALLAKWEGEFQAWFDELQSQMEGDVATNLQNQINELDERITPLESLGSRVDTNAYNIAMLTLMHAKEGEFPPNTQKMIVCIPAISSNVLDYSGLNNNSEKLRSIILTKSAKIRSGIGKKFLTSATGNELVQYPICYYERSQLYWIATTLSEGYRLTLIKEPLMNRDPEERETLLTFDVRRFSRKLFDFYKKSDGSLLISSYVSDSATSLSLTPVIYQLTSNWKISEAFRGSKNSVGGTDNGNLGCVLTEDAALYIWGTYGSNRGDAKVLKNNGSMTYLGSDKGYTINGYARSSDGLYVHTADGIKIFENYQLTDTNQGYEYGGLGMVHNDKVFFTTNGGGVMKKTDKLTFENIVLGSANVSSFIVMDGVMYAYDGVNVYRFNGTKFEAGVPITDFFNELGLNPGTTRLNNFPVISDGRDKYGAYSEAPYDTNESVLFDKSMSKNGFITFRFDGLPSFETVDLYVGGNMKNGKISVSTNGSSWTPDGEPGDVTTERYARFKISGSGSLYVKVNFDLGSGYIDYIVGGVY